MYKKGKLKKPIQYSFTVLLIVLFNHIYTVSKESKQARRKESREQTSVEQINSQTTGIHPERIKNKTKTKTKQEGHCISPTSRHKKRQPEISGIHVKIVTLFDLYFFP